jgi:hypothetical protein
LGIKHAARVNSTELARYMKFYDRNSPFPLMKWLANDVQNGDAFTKFCDSLAYFSLE